MKRVVTFLVSAAVLGCPMGQPALELSAGTLRVDGETNVSATATNGDQSAGTGPITFSATLGSLSATSAMLTDGAASTRLRCPRVVLGCVAGASIEVTARWTSSKGEVQKTVVVRVVDPPVSDAGPRVDAGQDAGTASDAGSDGGMDAGPPDAGPFDAGAPFDAGLLPGTPMQGVDSIVAGRLGPPRTIGFTQLIDRTVSLGFDSLPSQAVIWADRLVYVRNGVARIWSEDFMDGGPPLPVDAGDLDAGDVDGGDLDGGDLDGGDLDGGDLDGGDLDAGEQDAGARDAGPYGPFPLLRPEANDPIYATCFELSDAGAVRALLPTPSGRLVHGCSTSLTGPVTQYFGGTVTLTSATSARPLAALDDAVLAVQPNGDFVVLRATGPVQVARPNQRLFNLTAVRAVGREFELMVYDQAFARCGVAFIDGATGAYRQLLVNGFFTGDSTCVQGQFRAHRDVLLYPRFDAGAQNFIAEISFSRPAPDAGRPDAGRVDAGASDAGIADAGPPDAGPLFSGYIPGPPSDFLADPPTLSIDFAYPVQVYTTH
jgi:hypothetical protein